MSRSPIQIYALCVCFSALLCFVIALGVGLYDIVQITAPAFTLQELPYYHSNESYVQYFPDKRGLPTDEVTRLRLETYQEALASERRGCTTKHRLCSDHHRNRCGRLHHPLEDRQGGGT